MAIYKLCFLEEKCLYCEQQKQDENMPCNHKEVIMMDSICTQGDPKTNASLHALYIISKLSTEQVHYSD